MRQDGRSPDKQIELTACFSRVTNLLQNEILGRITVEILSQGRPVTRTTVCLKLIGWLDTAMDDKDAEHLNKLIGSLY